MGVQEILTVPTPEKHPKWLPTGNEWVSLSCIDRLHAGVHAVGSILLGRRGVVELRGESRRPGAKPLLRPVFFREDGEVDMRGKYRWERTDDWLPSFSSEAEGLSIRGTWVAPPGHRGFLLCLKVELEEDAKAVQVGLDGFLAATELCVFRPRRPPCQNVVLHDGWTSSVVLEANFAGDLMALGIGATVPFDVDACAGRQGTLESLPRGSEIISENDGESPISFRLRAGRVEPGGSFEMAFVFGVAPERDGARTTQIDLRRHGVQGLIESTKSWLEKRKGSLSDPSLNSFFNRNLLFNYFFACGRALDTEEVVSLTSRSPAYYVSGATWERDSLLWSFPALLLVDVDTARRMLLFMFSRHARNAGEHAHYLDGAVLYPGFELDELAAYFVALGRYLDATGDEGILDEPAVETSLPRLEAKLLSRRHPDPDIELYSTFLLSSDDPSPHPWVTYDNVLVWRAFEVLRCIYERKGNAEVGASHGVRARRIRSSIYEHLVHPEQKVFSWSADLAGEHRLYDEPSGSLLLLPYYGFCAKDDPVWIRTQEFLHSKDYPYYFGEGPFKGHGCLHYPEHPGGLGLAASLLCGRRDEALEVIRNAPLDEGLACETYEVETGEVRTGAAFATCAGLISWALAEALVVE